jgi:3-phenylpropionate/trans-cinnamate dioxygenase ferredoxin subunit
MRSVTVDRVAVVVLRTPDGAVHALRDACSHYGARLSLGSLRPLVAGDDVGEHRLVAGRYVVQCPWHGYEFDVGDGRCPADPAHQRVRSYRTSVVDGVVVIER